MVATRYDLIMAAARKTNAERPLTEPRVESLPLELQLQAAMAAFRTGIEIRSWSCVAEGQAMLESLSASIFSRQVPAGLATMHAALEKSIERTLSKPKEQSK